MAALAPSMQATASELETGSEGFGGPDSTEKMLQKDAGPKHPVFPTVVLGGVRDWKKGLQDQHGFAFSIDYSAAMLNSEGFSEDDAASGMVRFYGAWELVKRGQAASGALVWKVEHRHRYSDVPPSDFAIDEQGYVGLHEPPFSNQGARVTNLYWRQRFNDGNTTVVAGFLDATDYVDVYALASPWMHFMNFAFSTGSATMALPNDANIGIAAATMLGENFYVIGGINDTNSDPTDILEGFDTFFGDNEYFKSLEIGWTSAPAQLVLDNYHLTVWHKDAQDELAVRDGWGVNFSFTRYLNERWLPFLRGGWAEDGGSLLEKSLSAGFGYQRAPGRDLIGVGINWGDPNEDTFGSDLDDQFGAEAFYRMNVGQNLALTIDVQYLSDPALNPDESSLWMGNLRVRWAL